MHSFFLKREFWKWLVGGLFVVAALALIMPLSVDVASSYFMVTLDYGNGHQRQFTGRVGKHTSAWDTLQQANAHSLIDLDAAQDFYPASIDAFENGEGGHWNLYVNDARIATSPVDVSIHSGDRVIWRFE